MRRSGGDGRRTQLGASAHVVCTHPSTFLTLQHLLQHDSNMATMCDVSFDEMAMALSYISLGGAAPASSARGLPSLAPVKKDKKEKKAKKEDDDVSVVRGVVASPGKWFTLVVGRVESMYLRHHCCFGLADGRHTLPAP